MIKVGMSFFEKGRETTRYECVGIKNDGTIIGCNYEDGYGERQFHFSEDDIVVLKG